MARRDIVSSVNIVANYAFVILELLEKFDAAFEISIGDFDKNRFAIVTNRDGFNILDAETATMCGRTKTATGVCNGVSYQTADMDKEIIVRHNGRRVAMIFKSLLNDLRLVPPCVMEYDTACGLLCRAGEAKPPNETQFKMIAEILKHATAHAQKTTGGIKTRALSAEFDLVK